MRPRLILIFVGPFHLPRYTTVARLYRCEEINLDIQFAKIQTRKNRRCETLNEELEIEFENEQCNQNEAEERNFNCPGLEKVH